MTGAVHAASAAFQSFRRRDWWALSLPSRFRFPILCVWAMAPIVRGLDYISGGGSSTGILSAVEASAPLPVWGFFYLLGGLLAVAGILSRWIWPLSMGALICGATYTTMALGLTVTCFTELDGHGFRTPFMFFVFGFTWLTMALGYRSSIRRKEILRDMGVENGRAD